MMHHSFEFKNPGIAAYGYTIASLRWFCTAVFALFIPLTLVTGAYASTPVATAPMASTTVASTDDGAHHNEAAPDWLVGKFTPAATAHGSKPAGYCLLTITPKQLIFTEKPGGLVRVLTYRVVASKPDFVIVETEEDKNSHIVCIKKPVTVVQFDHNEYLLCIENQLRTGIADEKAEAACPTSFGSDPQVFDLTVYSSLEDALHIANSVRTNGGKAVMYWSAYW